MYVYLIMTICALCVFFTLLYDKKDILYIKQALDAALYHSYLTLEPFINAILFLPV